MPGFLYINNNNNINIDIEIKSLNKNLVIDEMKHENIYLKRFTNNKFLNDKLFFQDNESIVVIDGVILNLSKLREDNEDNFSLVKRLYKKYGNDFFKYFKGEFSGLLYDKIEKKTIVYTNQIGSKNIFYYKNENCFIVSSELKVIVQVLKKLKIKYSINEFGCQCLLTYGYMLEDITLINEITKLTAGNYLTYKNRELEKINYFRLQNEPYLKEDKDEIIENLDKLFREAVRIQFNKDDEYNYKYIAPLSGGLDSRMTVMVANELGFNDCLNVTCSQNDYLDEKIAKKIASDINNKWLFFSLNNGNYLKNIDECLICNDGMALYSGSAHVLEMFKNINFRRYGIYHSGQIGDAVLGSFLSSPNKNKPSINDGAYSNLIIRNMENQLKEIIKNYDSEEIFKFYNRAFNGTFNGDWTINQFTESASPFCDIDFLQYALRIPPKYKYKEKIYIEWILKKYPNIAKYKWERTGIKPTLFNNKVRIYAYSEKMIRKIFVKKQRSMNPFDDWYKENTQLKTYVNQYLIDNIQLLSSYPDLLNNCNYLIEKGSLIEKTQVMTLLGAIKLFIKDELPS
ncbi:MULTISPECIES: hypothetical protein [unclassified Clostridium]|uniref:hypothetical protein n=1 Tax=unclassified Clostridium TaxID=2614128 RepID=UPI0013F9BD90|nr:MULTISPECIES: hypothetical protein [unclassified Clostridium]NFN94090.1 asparagine synthase [Clostridium botulinum]NFS95148.1 asparagine synthase [Clostridium botulinum]